jgi:hypothetical protein
VSQAQENFMNRYARSDMERRAMRQLLDAYGEVDPAKADAFATRFLERDDEYGDPGAARLTAQILASHRGAPLSVGAVGGALRLMTRATDHPLAIREAVCRGMLAATHPETGLNPTLMALAVFPETAFQDFVRLSAGMVGYEEKSPNLPEEEEKEEEDKPDSAEAREWLTHNGNPAAFAQNKFEFTANALKFVDALYRAGALEVHVDNIQYEDQIGQDGPYSDSMVVRMPKEPERRAAVMEIINANCSDLSTVGGRFHDNGEREIGLWWD